MSHVEDIFDNSRSASMSGSRGENLSPGVYKVKITEIGIKESKDPAKAGALFFITEFEIVESDNDKHRPGTTGSVPTKVKPDPYKYGLADTKRLFFAALELDPGDEADHLCVELCQKAALNAASPAVKELAEKFKITDARNMIIGAVVKLEVALGKKKDGNPFTRYFWSAAE